MDALVRVAVPIGLHRSSVRPAEHTLILKSTYVLAHGGYAQPAPMQEALREAQREGGRLIYPTDFSESKAACDVVFVGPVLLGDGPVSLRAGVFQRNASTPRVFGPAVQLDRQWAASCAPADGRMPFPALPLALEMLGTTFRMSSTIPAPMPLAALVVRDRWSHMIGVALRVDTILIDPMRASVEVIAKGTFSYSGDVHQDVVAVVDTQAALATTSPDQMRTWPRVRVVDATFRRPAPTERSVPVATVRKPALTARLSAPTVAAPVAPPPANAYVDDPLSDDAPTFDGDESTFVLGDESLEDVIDAALGKAAHGPVPSETMTIDVEDAELLEPPTIPPPPHSMQEAMPATRPLGSPYAEAPRLDTITLDAPSTSDLVEPPNARAIPWSPVFNQPPDFKTGIIPVPEILNAGRDASLPPWIAASPPPAPTTTQGSGGAASVSGLPPLPSLSSLVVARDPNATAEVRRPAFAKGDPGDTGPTWLAQRNANAGARLSTEGTPFRAQNDPQPAAIAPAEPVSPFGLEQTATQLPLEPLAVREPPLVTPPVEPVKPPSALAGMGMALQRGAPPVISPPEPAIVMQPMGGMARLQAAPDVPPAAPSAPAIVVPPPPASVKPELVPPSRPIPPSRPVPPPRGSAPEIPKGDQSYSSIRKPDLMTPAEEARKKRAKPPPGNGPKIEGLTVEEYAFIRAALWADEAHRKEILKENGLTELKWKVIDRRWSKHIESLAEKPTELATLLEILQRATVDLDR